jgi:hypothetical protein
MFGSSRNVTIARLFHAPERRSNVTVFCPFHTGKGASIVARGLVPHLTTSHALSDKDARLIAARAIAAAQ